MKAGVPAGSFDIRCGESRDLPNCHCRFCQRLLGTAFAAVAYFDERNVTFLQGELTQYEQRSLTRPEGGSGCSSALIAGRRLPMPYKYGRV